jgi:hypothetical protein
MAGKVLKNKAKTPQQWAWEFLRRNPEYREAFRRLTSLTPLQLEQMNKLFRGFSASEVDMEIVLALDIEFFDKSRMFGFKDTQKTVGEYLSQTQELRASFGEVEVHLPIARKFYLETYLLDGWCDPDADLTPNETNVIWTHAIPLNLGLIRAPSGDGIKTHDEICDSTGWHGFSVSEGRTAPPPKRPDRRLRKKPQYDGMFGYRKGTDGRAFVAKQESVEFEIHETQASAVFDLSLPLEIQFTRLRQVLQGHQEDLIKSGFVASIPKHADRFGAFSEYLKILDMLADGLSHLDIAKITDGRLTTKTRLVHDSKANKLVKVSEVVSRSDTGTRVNKLTATVRKKIERAISLRDHGYRALALTA